MFYRALDTKDCIWGDPFVAYSLQGAKHCATNQLRSSNIVLYNMDYTVLAIKNGEWQDVLEEQSKD